MKGISGSYQRIMHSPKGIFTGKLFVHTIGVASLPCTLAPQLQQTMENKMNKVMAGVCVAATLVSASVQAEESAYYAGLTLGRSRTGSPTPDMILSQSNDTVGGVLGGYQFDNNWALEAFYTEAGKFAGQNAAGSVTGNGKADVWGADVMAMLPMSGAFSLYGKLGLASIRVRVNTAPASTLSGDTRTASSYGLGGMYNFNPAFGMRLGWERYGALPTGGSGGAKDDYNINVYSLAAVLKF